MLVHVYKSSFLLYQVLNDELFSVKYSRYGALLLSRDFHSVIWNMHMHFNNSDYAAAVFSPPSPQSKGTKSQIQLLSKIMPI